MEFDNIETVKRAVEIDHGIAIVPHATVTQESNQGTLVVLPFKGRAFTRPLAILQRKGRSAHPGDEEVPRNARAQPARYAVYHVYETDASFGSGLGLSPRRSRFAACKPKAGSSASGFALAPARGCLRSLRGGAIPDAGRRSSGRCLAAGADLDGNAVNSGQFEGKGCRPRLLGNLVRAVPGGRFPATWSLQRNTPRTAWSSWACPPTRLGARRR